MTGHRRTCGGIMRRRFTSIAGAVAGLSVVLSIAVILATFACVTAGYIRGFEPELDDGFPLLPLLWGALAVIAAPSCILRRDADEPGLCSAVLSCVFVVAFTVVQFACVGIGVHRMWTAAFPPPGPELRYSVRIDPKERGTVPERPEPVRVDMPARCPADGSVKVADSDGWDEYLYVDMHELADYAKRCGIDRLEQHYDGHELVLREFQADGRNG